VTLSKVFIAALPIYTRYNMEAADSSKTLLHVSQTTQRHAHEGRNINKVLMFIYGLFKNVANISGDVTTFLQSSVPDTSQREPS
jgi:hypothetical protein